MSGGKSLSVVSINIQDLPAFVPVMDRRVRRHRMLTQLPGLGADLLLLQESFVPAFRMRLQQALRDLTPANATRCNGRSLFPACGGLLTFSRFPVSWSRFVAWPRFPSMKLDERFGRKGFLLSELETPRGALLVCHVHMYAGKRPPCARVRRSQVELLIEYLDPFRGRSILLAGDFNMDPAYEVIDGGATTGWELLLAAGFREAAQGSNDGLRTFEPSTNDYARYTFVKNYDCRLTQFFVRGEGLEVVSAPELCLTDPPVSDHYGLRVRMIVG